MDVIKNNDEGKLVIRQTFSFPRELVFDAWTKPEHLTKWFFPKDEVTLSIAEVDLREGGEYTLGFDEACAPRSVVRGVFTTVNIPEKLSYTWTWDEPVPGAGEEMFVTVEFIDKQGETELVLTHEKLVSAEILEQHETGWCGAISHLEDFCQKL